MGNDTFRTVMKGFVIIIGAMVVALVGITLYFNIANSSKRAPMQKDVNTVIFELIRAGQENKVYEFYDRIVGDRKLTYMIVSTALLYDIPVNYFMSLCYTESRFTVTAVGRNLTADGVVWSYDYGLFQLNSETFKSYDRDYLMVPENNIRMAAEYLKDKYKKYRNWYETIISYNAGGTELIKNRTIKHLVSVLSMHEDLDGKFVLEF
jgi:soluble lytic murein transglycosylase-like protein